MPTISTHWNGASAMHCRRRNPKLAIYTCRRAILVAPIGSAGLRYRRKDCARDQMVLDLWRAADLPAAIAIAGGYSRTADLADIHIRTVEVAAHFQCAARQFRFSPDRDA